MQPSFVIGTAGHIDHGKSTLVKALTGIDPDRLAEEKARGMTIDLGFAWFASPAGRSISVVDVPGHERFIKNMLAGVGGIDAALLVIAADEGPMPQTREHLAILDLLGIEQAVVALTKSDLVEPDWLDLVGEEIAELLANTTLAGSPIVPVSPVSGKGMPALLTAIDGMLAGERPQAGRDRPRLPIDRVFTVAGFGTVVTGTLLGGELAVGQELVLLPDGKPTRVRGLQSHTQKVERALPNRRVAVNVANLAVSEIERGDVLAAPGLLTPVQRIDARLRLLPDAPAALEQNAQVDLFAGAAELPAWLTLLDRQRLEPGDSGWVQFRFRRPLALLKGDRFIVRRPSPSLTIGGGEVIDPNPVRHRRFRPEVLSALETLAAGSPDEIVLQHLASGPFELRALRQTLAGLSAEQVDAAIEQLIGEGDALDLSRDGGESPRPGDFLAATTSWERIGREIATALAAFHAEYPLRKGMPREALKGKLGLAGPPRLLDDLLRTATARGLLVDEGGNVRAPSFAIRLDSRQESVARRYLAALVDAPLTPPAPADHGIDGETLGALVDLGRITKIAEGIYFAPTVYAKIEAEVIDLLERQGTMTLAGFRDHFQTSRKYAQALLEYLDQRRITRRVGDERVRFAGAGAGLAIGGNR